MNASCASDMGIDVTVEVVKPRRLAAVRRRVPVGAVASAWRPALDQVWAFLRSEPGLRTDGHNIFLYHPPARRGEPMNVDFGVEVTRSFSPSGEVYETATPRGEAAFAVHRGGYDRLHGAHDAIHQWAKSNARILAGTSWEIYSDWSDDPSKLETVVVYLLA
jgi:effector-binding domain-containing protein